MIRNEEQFFAILAEELGMSFRPLRKSYEAYCENQDSFDPNETLEMSLTGWATDMTSMPAPFGKNVEKFQNACKTAGLWGGN